MISIQTKKKKFIKKVVFSTVELYYFPNSLDVFIKVKQYMDDKFNLTSITVQLQVVCVRKEVLSCLKIDLSCAILGKVLITCIYLNQKFVDIQQNMIKPFL